MPITQPMAKPISHTVGYINTEIAEAYRTATDEDRYAIGMACLMLLKDGVGIKVGVKDNNNKGQVYANMHFKLQSGENVVKGNMQLNVSRRLKADFQRQLINAIFGQKVSEKGTGVADDQDDAYLQELKSLGLDTTTKSQEE